MITYIDSKNANKYSRLFLDAQNALKDQWRCELEKSLSGAQLEAELASKITEAFGAKVSGTSADEKDAEYENGINSLNTYFSWIKDLLEITTIKDPNNETMPFDGMRFSMLPLDEEVFSINANTRTITVPTEFIKNGVAVQTDEIAEIVYFTIDRFYDATDLFTQDIMIEWIAPSGLKGYSVPTVKILDDTADHVVFGWALASALTETAGDITFAVRFYKYDSERDVLTYSLSTLTQKVKVQPNIGLEIADLLGRDGNMEGYKVLGNEIKTLIRERAENSQVIGSLGDVAEVPMVYHVLQQNREYLTDNSEKNIVVFSLATDDNDQPLGYQAVCEGSGYSEDGGQISYYWKKFDYYTGSRISDLDTPFGYSEEFISVTPDEVFDIEKTDKPLIHAGLKLYAKTEVPAAEEGADPIITYSLIGEPNYTTLSDQIANEEIAGICIKGSVCVFDAVGYYKFVVRNRKGKNSAECESLPFVVYPPATPQFTSITEHAYLVDDDTHPNKIIVEYEIPDAPDEKPSFAKGVTADANAYYADEEKTVIAPEYAFNHSLEEVTFEWKHEDLSGNVHVLDETGAELTLDLEDTNAEGIYSCKMTGTLNGVSCHTAESTDASINKVCKVSYLAETPITTLTGKNAEETVQTITNNLTLDVENLSDPRLSDYTRWMAHRNEPLTLTYDIEALKGVADHALTETLTGQWYCYEVERDRETNRAIGSLTIEDAIDAVCGKYEPDMVGGAFHPADRVLTSADIDEEGVDTTFTFSAAELANKADNVLSQITPKSDGYYFCIITNTYNGDAVTVSTPIVYFDNLSN